MLNFSQFTLLAALEKQTQPLTQRELAKQSGVSLGTANKCAAFFADNGFAQNGLITDKGRAALEPYRVKRAIFLAAGFGSRLVPITLNTPKPLVKVHGKRMIETLLDAVAAVGIEEIVVVRGYLGEQFDVLKKKYPSIRFVENALYNEANNISSVYLVRDLLENSYVFESDLVLSNPALVTKYQYCSNYLGAPVAKTDDWCFKVANGRITKLCVGGTDCYHMFGISYWDSADGAKLKGHIQAVYEMPGGRERYWDQVPLEYFIGEYDISVRDCTFDDIAEIDSFRDLKNIDKAYDC